MKNLVLDNCDKRRAEILVEEIGKVRCWINGFTAGRHIPGSMDYMIQGHDALRQLQIILQDSIRKAK